MASSLAKGKSNTIGVIIPGFLIHFYASAISGIQDVAARAGYNNMVCQSNESYQMEVNNVQTLLASRVDGLIVSVSKETCDYGHFAHVLEKGIPLIFFNRVCEEINTSKVTVDDYEGAFQAVEHLIGEGCRRIAHIAGPENLLNTRAASMAIWTPSGSTTTPPRRSCWCAVTSQWKTACGPPASWWTWPTARTRFLS